MEAAGITFWTGSALALAAPGTLLALRRIRWGAGILLGLSMLLLTAGGSLVVLGAFDCVGTYQSYRGDGVTATVCVERTVTRSSVVFGALVMGAGAIILAGPFRTERRSPSVSRGRALRKTLRLLIGLGAAFLLPSLGGAQVMAAPATVPALWWAARGSSRSAATLLNLVASLTMLVVGWALAYWMSPGQKQLQWAVGAMTGVFTSVVFARTTTDHGAH